MQHPYMNVVFFPLKQEKNLRVRHEIVFWALETLLFLEAGSEFQSENVALTN